MCNAEGKGEKRIQALEKVHFPSDVVCYWNSLKNKNNNQTWWVPFSKNNLKIRREVKKKKS